jgi:hypothetical protein
MKKLILYLFLTGLFFGCNSENMDIDIEANAPNQILMLKVDYTTSAFEGGTIIGFPKKTDNFTIGNEYVEPSDFGSVKLIYKELNQTLFEGTIHWMGLGKMRFPEKLEPAGFFEFVLTEDILYPNGFENVFNPDNRELDYEKVWLSVQGLVKVREFLAANPNQKAKLFLYTPSVGTGDPTDWDWIIYLKK